MRTRPLLNGWVEIRVAVIGQDHADYDCGQQEQQDPGQHDQEWW